jgi:ferredoxin-NADP reductase
MRVTFDHSEQLADRISSFYFRPEKPLLYTAGQFIELTLAHHNPDDHGQKRWFTLSSAPTEELLSITTKFPVKHLSSYKRALQKLQPGDQLTMSDPMGDFVLPKLIQTPLIFVAGGIGITPFHSMLSWIATTGEERPIRLIQSVWNEEDIIFQDTFKHAGQHATIVVSKASAMWGGERGPLTAELVIGLQPVTKDTLIYISGPESMVEQLSNDLHSAGVPRPQLVGDYFPGYQTI